ncbi:hypothetical protein RJD24_18750 [Bacillaceae bacterium IKA-2]|nr:hypothetical protein RJD24_18750 [Bacillaceae bacterium IKA-2]
MKGLCVDDRESTTLQKGKSYFIFENGPHHVYVSRFNNKNAHMGCYKMQRFQVIEEEEVKIKEAPLLPLEEWQQMSLF